MRLCWPQVYENLEDVNILEDVNDSTGRTEAYSLLWLNYKNMQLAELPKPNNNSLPVTCSELYISFSFLGGAEIEDAHWQWQMSKG